MTKYIAVIIILFGAHTALTQSTPFYNFGFEEKLSKRVAIGWGKWGHHNLYIDSVAHSGKYSMKVVSDGSLGKFGAAVYTIPVSHKGRNIRLEGYIKIKDVDGYASLIVRTDDKKGRTLFFANQSEDIISGTCDWQKYQVSIPFPVNANRIHVAGILSGKGEAWFDDFSVYIDDLDILDIEKIERSNFKDFSFQHNYLKEHSKNSEWILTLLIISIAILLIIVIILISRNISRRPRTTKNDNTTLASPLLNKVPKHQEISDGLQKLIQDEEYLKTDFNLTKAAKMMQTNTSYLSQFVNSEFEKTFREYYTDLRIEYTLQQMNTDKRFRNYTTQAIAESVGYKNALSFSRIFKRKTGLTPTQYVSLVEQKIANSSR